MNTPISQYLIHSLPDLKSLPRLAWFDNSTIESFQNCNRESWYNANLGLSQKSAPMAAGSVWHAGLEIWHSTKDINLANVALAREYQHHQGVLANGPNRLSFGNLNEAFRQYTEKYQNDQIQYHEQEFKFAIWMIGKHIEEELGGEKSGTLIPDCEPNQCRFSPNVSNACFWYVGRFDGIITYAGELLLLENKSVGQMGPTYLAGLQMSRQARAYTACTRKILSANNYPGQPLKGVLFNVVRLGSSIEFNRFVVMCPNKMLWEWEEETYDLVAQIRQSWSSYKKPVKNTRSCTQYGLCPYIDLCQSWAGRPKDQKPGVFTNYKVEHWTPF